MHTKNQPIYPFKVAHNLQKPFGMLQQKSKRANIYYFKKQKKQFPIKKNEKRIVKVMKKSDLTPEYTDTEVSKQQAKDGRQSSNFTESYNRSAKTIDNGYYSRHVKITKTNKTILQNNAQLHLTTCLTQSQKTKVFRGFSIRHGTEVIIKSVLINRGTIAGYKLILGVAELYYQVHKRNVNDLVIRQKKIMAYANTKNTPVASQKKQQEPFYLEFIRPYFSGRNFHEQVYVHSKFPFDFDELPQFITSVLKMLITDSHEPTFISTLDNIYFDGIQIIANMTSFQTYMFLRHINQHLSTQNFKQLYILLPSDPAIFCDWDRMRQYMFETIKIKAFFVMLFCFITIRSPIQMIFGQKINQQDLEWPRIFDPKTSKINYSNKIINLIKDIPNRWRALLDKPENQKCLEKASIQIFYALKNINPALKDVSFDIKSELCSNDQKNYLFNLYSNIFVIEKPFGWNDFFQMKKNCSSLFVREKTLQKFGQNLTSEQEQEYLQRQYLSGCEPLRAYVIEMGKDEQLKKKEIEEQERWKRLKQRQKYIKKEPDQEFDTSTQTSPETEAIESKAMRENEGRLYTRKLDLWEWKRATAKSAFVYLHKYYMALDIEKRKLNPQQAVNFARALNFQTYLPLKLEIPLTITLIYQNWFEIFFEETGDKRPTIYDAAKKIENLLREKSYQIMKLVKGCELAHLKRIHYVVSTKLAQLGDQPQILQDINTEVKEFTTEVKLYEHMLWSASQAIRNASHEEQFKTLQHLRMYEGQIYDDIRLLLIQYLRIKDMYAKPEGSRETLSEFQQMVDIGRLLNKVNMLKGSAKLKKAFRNMLNVQTQQ